MTDSWVRLPVPMAGLPVVSATPTGQAMKPANTVPTPPGFNALAPGNIFSALPRNSQDTFSAVQSANHVIAPFVTTERCEAKARTRVKILDFPYGLNAGTENIVTVSMASVIATETDGESGGGSGGQTGETVFLMHFDGADAERVFTESSGSGATFWITTPESWGPTGTSAPALSTLQAKHGATSLLMGEASEGMNDREGYAVITLPAAIGTQDFTIEVWYKSIWMGYFNNTTIPFFITTQDSEDITYSLWNWGGSSGACGFEYSANGNQYLETLDVLQADQWCHLCMERHLGRLYIYANGNLATELEYTAGQFIDNANYNLSDKIGIGAKSVATDNSGYNGKSWGYWDELRVVIGSGVYQGTAFTPPTAPFSDPQP